MTTTRIGLNVCVDLTSTCSKVSYRLVVVFRNLYYDLYSIPNIHKSVYGLECLAMACAFLKNSLSKVAFPSWSIVLSAIFDLGLFSAFLKPVSYEMACRTIVSFDTLQFKCRGADDKTACFLILAAVVLAKHSHA